MRNSFEPVSSPCSSDDPTVEVFDLVDPTAASEGFDALDQQVVHLDTGRFQARRVVVRLVSCSVVFHWAKTRVRSQATVHDDLMAFGLFGPAGRGTLNGIPVAADLLAVAEPGAVAELVVEPGYRSITVMIPPAGVEEHLCRRGREGEFRMPSGVELRRAAVARVRPLFDLCRRLTGTAARRPGLFDDRAEVRAAADIEVVDTLLDILDSSDPLKPSRRERTSQRYGQIVRCAEERALGTRATSLYVADLCDAAGVSERTLQMAFQRTVGLSPISFLKRARLHGARRALREGSTRSTTVSEVAVEWGFWHFGEFSKAYKACFGECPSATLRGSSSRFVSS
jgi:AraC-like DNA-binding protein